MSRHLHSIDEIKAMLCDRIEDLVATYAPPANGSYRDRGRYWTLNPGRADRSVGSFFVWVSGPDVGRWGDFGPKQFGDVLDLIGLSIGVSNVRDQLTEARAFLGLATMTPEEKRRSEERAAELRRERAAHARDNAKKALRRSKQAHALWLSGAPIKGTPAQIYLEQRRGIDFAALGRWPGALRYVPHCFYQHTDPETGEVIEGRWPAMVAIATNAKGQAVACHRTYLGIDPLDGRYNKAALPKAKKVLGGYRGAWINLWAGIGPRGGKPPPMRQAPPGSMVHVAEGIEDALSAAMLCPEGRHVAAISLSNIGSLQFPPSIGEVVLICDRDEGEQAQKAITSAIAAHRAAGRRVRTWLPPEGLKDLNEALLKALRDRREDHDAA